MPQILLPLLGGISDSVNPPETPFTAAGRPRLAYDDTTDEIGIWTLPVPDDYASGMTLTAIYSAVAITGVIRLRIESMVVADGAAILADNFGAVTPSADDTVPGVAGVRGTVSMAVPGVLVAGSYLALRIGRENLTGGTNAVGDMSVWDYSMAYTGS